MPRLKGYSEDIATFLAMVSRLLYSHVLIELNISEEEKKHLEDRVQEKVQYLC